MEAVTIILLLALLATVAGGGFAIWRLYQQKLELERNPRLSDEQALNLVNKEAKLKLQKAEEEAEAKLEQARQESKRIISTSKSIEDELTVREQTLVSRAKTLDERLASVDNREKDMDSEKEKVRAERLRLTTELEKIAQMTKQDAEKELKSELEKDLSSWTAKQIKEAEFEIKHQSEERARDILIDAMQKGASDYVAENTTTTVDIPDDALKSKIIGKEGRNIRAFQRLTGTDIIVDEAPGQVTISCFDPVRREVAALALQKLVKAGTIHPAAIEDTVRNIKNDIQREIRRTGEKLAYDTGFNDLPDEIIKLLGRYKYRFSYGQNLAKHSLEMVQIGAYLAQEVGADVKFVKLACLLHDIGKVMTHEFEGKPHHHISGDIIRKYMKDEKLANAVEAHHGDIETKSLEAVLLIIADHISGARPGARRDSHEEYIKRVTSLETIAKRYTEVQEAYALQAGREVRVIVKPEIMNDDDTKVLAYKIAKEIEDTQTYPGTVKVTVIREYRAIAEAR
jgi:ribonucrease Y